MNGPGSWACRPGPDDHVVQGGLVCLRATRRYPEFDHDVLGVAPAVGHPLKSGREHPIPLGQGVRCRRHDCSITRSVDRRPSTVAVFAGNSRATER